MVIIFDQKFWFYLIVVAQRQASIFCFLKERKRKGRIWKEESALEEETDNWVLLKKTGQKFGRNT